MTTDDAKEIVKNSVSEAVKYCKTQEKLAKRVVDRIYYRAPPIHIGADAGRI